MFDADKLPQSWLLVKNDYPVLSDIATKISLPFVTAYLIFCCCCDEKVLIIVGNGK
jgi:hypothetical protein